MIAGVFGLSCTEPNTPESLTPPAAGYNIVARYETPGFAQDITLQDTIAYIAQGEGGVAIISIADPVHPRLLSIASNELRGYSAKVAVKGTTVFVAAGTFGVSVVDATNPAEPFTTASNLSMKPARSFHLFGDYLFTAVSEQGVRIAEISAPTDPDIRGTLDTPGFARTVTTTADSTRLLVGCGEMGFALYDIRDMRNGFGGYPLIGWTDTPGYVEHVAIIPGTDVALLACGYAGLQVVDFSDTSNIHVVGSCALEGYSKEIIYDRGRAYITTETKGLQVVSVATPSRPQLMGVLDTEFARGLATDGQYLYIADDVEGLLVVSIPPF